MLYKAKYVRMVSILCTVAFCVLGQGCFVMYPGEKDIKSGEESESNKNMDAVREAFNAAKAYAQNDTSIDKVKAAFKALTTRQSKEALAKMTDEDHSFTSYLVAGKASLDSANIIYQFLNGIPEEMARGQIDAAPGGLNAFAALRSNNRPTGEDPAQRDKILAILLPFEPAQVNQFTSAQRFDAAKLSGVLALLKPGRSGRVVDALTPSNFQDWLDWAMQNLALAERAFHNVYTQTGLDSRRVTMRNDLLAKSYAQGKRGLLNVVSRLGAYGLADGLAHEVHTLDGKSGNLLYVLVSQIKSDTDNRLGTLRLDELREISQPIQALLASRYAQFASNALAELGDTTKNKYLLSLDELFTVDEVMDEATRLAGLPVNESDHMLKSLFDGAVRSKESADALAKLSKANGSFIHQLAKLRVSPQTAAILNSFLALLDAEQARAAMKKLSGAGGNQTALMMLADATRDVGALTQGENKLIRQRMITKLVQKSEVVDISKVNTPADFKNLLEAVGAEDTPEELKKVFIAAPDDAAKRALATWAVHNRSRGKLASGALYESTSDVLEKRKFREFLLTEAFPDQQAVLDLIKDSAWGLRSGLATDDYHIAFVGVPNWQGSMLGALTRWAAEHNNFDALRNYAEATREVLDNPNTYRNLVTTIMPLGASEVALNYLDGALTNTRSGLANDYLAYDEIEGLFRGAGDFATTLNPDFYRLYYLVMVDPDKIAKAQELAGKAGPGPAHRKFIHDVTTRPADGFTSPILNDFLAAVGAPVNTGRADVAAQVAAPLPGNVYPLAILLPIGRAGDVLDDKNEMIARLVQGDDGTSIAAVAANETATLLNAVLAKGRAADLQKALAYVSDVDELSEWCAHNFGAQISDGHAYIKIGSLFQQEYARADAPVRSAEDKFKMLNLVVRMAFADGVAGAGAVAAVQQARAGIDRVKALINNYFFSAATLQETTFNPWTAHAAAWAAKQLGPQANLAYAVLNQANMLDGTALQDMNTVKGFFTVLSNRAELNNNKVVWRAHVIDADNNGVPGTTVLNLVQVHGTGGNLANAQNWTLYN